MGIIIIPLQQPRPEDVAPEPPRLVPVVQVKWDKSGSKEITISDLALEVCSAPEELVKDVLRLRANAHLVQQLFIDHGKPALAKLAERIQKDPDFKALYGLLMQDPNDQAPGDVAAPNAAFPAFDAQVQSLDLARSLGDDFRQWKLNVDGRGVLLTLEYSQHEYAVCSANRSTLQWGTFKTDVDQYQAALKKLDPHLKKLESAIKAYEDAARAWANGQGKDGLEALAIISTFESVTDVYRKQDQRFDLVDSFAREFVDRTSLLVVDSLQQATKAQVKALRDIDKNNDFLKALFEFYLLWDPTRHYYFHAVAAKALGAANFDDRLFHALNMSAQYMASSPETAAEVGKELTQNIDAVWSDAVEVGLPPNASFRDRVERARKKFDELAAAGQVHSAISTAVVWSGYLTNLVGNFEGPPSVLSMGLLRFSRSERFVQMMGRDTLAKGALLIGLSRLERQGILDQIRAGNTDVARKLFNNGSWRSPALYGVFSVMTLAITIFHVDQLVDKLQKDGDQTAFDAEFFNLLGPLIQDAANIGLTGLTFLYSRDLNAFLGSNLKTRTRALGAVIESLETQGWRVVAVKVTHGVLASVGLMLSAWDYYDNRNRLDTPEAIIKVGLIGASLACVLGAFGFTAWLGPAGFVAGLVLAIALAVYDGFFKPKLAGTFDSMLDAYKKTGFFTTHSATVIDRTTWMIFFTENVTVEDVFDRLQSMTSSLSPVDKLHPAHLIEYFRSGIPVPQLATLYDMEESQVREEIKKVQFQQTQAAAQNLVTDVQLVSPGSENTTLILGTMNTLRVLVFNHPCDQIWLEWALDGQDPTVFLSGPNFDAQKKIVVLNAVSGKRRGDVQEFSGTFAINQLPPTVGGQTVTPFKLRVPKNRRPELPNLESSLMRTLHFPVKDLP
jgi:hypothetical protein